LVKTMSEALSRIFSMSLAAALYVATQTTARMFECLRSSFMASDTSAVFRWYPSRRIFDESRPYRRIARATPSKPASPKLSCCANTAMSVGLMRFTSTRCLTIAAVSSA